MNGVLAVGAGFGGGAPYLFSPFVVGDHVHFVFTEYSTALRLSRLRGEKERERGRERYGGWSTYNDSLTPMGLLMKAAVVRAACSGNQAKTRIRWYKMLAGIKYVSDFTMALAI